MGFWRIGLSLLVTASLSTGCGGGSGSVAQPPLIADTAAAYWAGGAGSRWSYQLTDARGGANPTPVFKTVEDRGEVVINGRLARRFDHSWSLFGAVPETEYRYFDGREIRNVIQLGDLFGISLPAQDYAEVPAPLREGETTTVFDQSQSLDLDGDGVPDQLRIAYRITLATQAALTVPAGDFKNLLRSRQEAVATVTLGATGASFSASAVLTLWYAPGVGIVRRVFEDPNFAAPNNTATEELVGVAHASVRAGKVANLTGLDSLGAGTDSGVPGGGDMAVGAGRFVLVSATTGGTIEGAIHDDLGNPVWRGTVLAAAAPYQFQGAAVAYDGTDFRVVAVRNIPYSSPTEYALIAQRVSTSGALRDSLAGAVLDSGVPDPSQTLAGLRLAARQGQLLAAWGRYDPTYVSIGPGLVTSRGYVIEGRLFDALQQPAAARFELGSGLPGALAVRADQYILVNSSQDSTVTTLSSWAVGADGSVVNGAGQAVSQTALPKGGSRLQTVGTEFWLSYAERSSGTDTMAPWSIQVARLGRAGVLLDGTPAAPGHTLLAAESTRGGSLVVLGANRSLLAWSEGWDSVRATLFDSSVLNSSAALPATSVPLVPDRPGGTVGPSRSIVQGADLGSALLVVWLDNEQSAATPSDRLMYTLVYPRYVAP